MFQWGTNVCIMFWTYTCDIIAWCRWRRTAAMGTYMCISPTAPHRTPSSTTTHCVYIFLGRFWFICLFWKSVVYRCLSMNCICWCGYVSRDNNVWSELFTGVRAVYTVAKYRGIVYRKTTAKEIHSKQMAHTVVFIAVIECMHVLMVLKVYIRQDR